MYDYSELLYSIRHPIICVLMEHTPSSAAPWRVLSARVPRDSVHSWTNITMIYNRPGPTPKKEGKMRQFSGNDYRSLHLILCFPRLVTLL